MKQHSKVKVPPPEGFHYRAEILPPEEEQELIERIAGLPLKEFEFHGYTGKRRVISFGLHYDFETEKLHQAEGIPSFLQHARARRGICRPTGG